MKIEEAWPSIKALYPEAAYVMSVGSSTCHFPLYDDKGGYLHTCPHNNLDFGGKTQYPIGEPLYRNAEFPLDYGRRVIAQEVDGEPWLDGILVGYFESNFIVFNEVVGDYVDAEHVRVKVKNDS